MYSYTAKISVAYDHQTLNRMNKLSKHFSGIERYQAGIIRCEERILADFNFSSNFNFRSEFYPDGRVRVLVSDIFNSLVDGNEITFILEIRKLTQSKKMICKPKFISVNKEGQFHSFEDKPAIIFSNGEEHWYTNGKLNRDKDKPSIICMDGRLYFYKNGKLHREEDKPAVTLPNGHRIWYWEGKKHRVDKPAEIFPDGSEFWYQNGFLHREEGLPSMIILSPEFCPIQGMEPLSREYYFRHGQKHGKIVDLEGSEFWYKYGELDRENDFFQKPC